MIVKREQLSSSTVLPGHDNQNCNIGKGLTFDIEIYKYFFIVFLNTVTLLEIINLLI